MIEQVSYLKAPIFVWWDITYRCNFRCKQCYSSSGLPLPDELTFEEVCSVLDELAEMEVFYVYFLGGEPFMRRDFLDILRHCADLELTSVINTNGWFVDEGLAQTLKGIGVQHVRVSVDGATAETHDAIRMPGSFERVIRALRVLKEVGIDTGLTATLMRDNMHEANAIIDVARRCGVDEMQMVQLCATGRGASAEGVPPDKLPEIRRAMEAKIQECSDELSVFVTEGISPNRYLDEVMSRQLVPGIVGCIAGRTSVCITADGKVTPCLLDRRATRVLGDLRQTSFRYIWEEAPEMRELRAVDPSCMGCDYVGICLRECPLESPIPDAVRTWYSERCQQAA